MKVPPAATQVKAHTTTPAEEGLEEAAGAPEKRADIASPKEAVARTPTAPKAPVKKPLPLKTTASTAEMMRRLGSYAPDAPTKKKRLKDDKKISEPTATAPAAKPAVPQAAMSKPSSTSATGLKVAAVAKKKPQQSLAGETCVYHYSVECEAVSSRWIPFNNCIHQDEGEDATEKAAAVTTAEVSKAAEKVSGLKGNERISLQHDAPAIVVSTGLNLAMQVPPSKKDKGAPAPKKEDKCPVPRTAYNVFCSEMRTKVTGE